MYRRLDEGHTGFGMIVIDHGFLRKKPWNYTAREMDYKSNHGYQLMFRMAPLSTPWPDDIAADCTTGLDTVRAVLRCPRKLPPSTTLSPPHPLVTRRIDKRIWQIQHRPRLRQPDHTASRLVRAGRGIVRGHMPQ